MQWLHTTGLRTMLPLAALLACSPTPDLSRPEGPLGGKIYDEKVVVTGASDLNVVLFDRLTVTIPAAAYPVGTGVTLRIVDCLQRGDSPIVLSLMLDHWSDDNPTHAALQILPASPAPAVALPIHIQMAAAVTSGYIHVDTSQGFDILHAHESDASFTTTAQDQDSTDSGAGAAFAFSVAEPGLWTVAQWPLPPSLQGRFVLVSDDDHAPVLPEYLDIEGRSYTWARTNSQGCVSIETGSLAAPESDQLVFHAQDRTTTSHYLWQIGSDSLSMDLETFQLQANNRAPLIAGCPSDAGQAHDGGVDGAHGG